MTQPTNRRLVTEAKLATDLGTKVNSSTYTAGLAGKQDVSTLDAATATNVTSGAATSAALRAAFVSVLVYANSAYPARPPGVPGGLVKYIGPVQPTTWLSGDEWVNNS